MKPDWLPPGVVPFVDPPPPVAAWQGNVWTPCPASALEYVGVAPRKDHLEQGITPEEAILRGIAPRTPTPGEYKDWVERFPGLASPCWWVTEDFASGGYNCFGYVIALEAVKKGDTIRNWEPANLPLDGSVDKYDVFFGMFGYTRIPEPAGTNVPPAARIAWFDGPHVALRSDYRFKGEDLWESKLGLYQLRILHSLRAVEGDEYGKLMRWYRLS